MVMKSSNWIDVSSSSILRANGHAFCLATFLFIVAIEVVLRFEFPQEWAFIETLIMGSVFVVTIGLAYVISLSVKDDVVPPVYRGFTLAAQIALIWVAYAYGRLYVMTGEYVAPIPFGSVLWTSIFIMFALSFPVFQYEGLVLRWIANASLRKRQLVMAALLLFGVLASVAIFAM